MPETRTDVVYNVKNAPFITLTESRMPNLWYHETFTVLFILTARGFKLIPTPGKSFLEQSRLL